MAARADKRKARASARLLEDELRGVAQVLDTILAPPDEEPVPGATDADEKRRRLVDELLNRRALPSVSDERWNEHRAVLAETLPSDSWYFVSRAYATFPDLRAFGELARDTPLDEDGRRQAGPMLTEIRDTISRGASALSHLAGTEPVRAHNERHH
jgi:hypothetical protein